VPKYLISIGRDITEQMLIQENLRQQYDRTQQYLDIAGVILLALNKVGEVELINQKGCEVLGFSEEEILGSNWFDRFLHEEEKEIVNSTFQQLMMGKHKSVEYHENKIRTSDGKTRIIAWHNKILKNDEGSIIGTLSSGEDITNQKAAEKELKESEFRYRMLSDLNREGILIHNNGIILDLNRAFCDIFGYKDDELIGFNAIEKIFTPESAEKARQNIKTENTGNILLNGIKKDGSLIWVELNVRNIKYNNNQARVATVRDVTELTQAKEALLNSEEKYRSLIENSPVVSWTTSESGETVFVSSNIKQVYGFSSSEVLEAGPKLWLERIHPDDIEKVTSDFSDLFKKGSDFSVEYRIKRKDGEWIWLQDKATTVKNINGKRNAFGAFFDITDKKNAQKALIEAEEKFSKAFFNNPDPLYFTSIPEGIFIDINPMFEKLSGYSRKELIGKPVTDFDFYINKEDRTKLFEELKNKGRLEAYDLPFKIKNGKIIDCLIYSEIIDIQDKPCLLSIVRDITEKKLSEVKLRESERMAKALMNATQDMAMLIDKSGKIVAINNSMARGLGHTPDNLVNNVIFDYLPPELTEQRKRKGEEARESGDVVRFTDKRGDRWLDNSVYPIFDEQQNLLQYAIFSHDITKRKVAEEAIKSSEERLKIIFDSAPDAIYLNDLKGNFFDANKAAQDMLGYNKEELVGKNLLKLNLLSVNQVAKAANRLLKNAQGLGTGPDDFILNCKDGSKVQVEIRTYPVKIENKSVVLGIARDITERKRSELALKESETRYRSIFNKSLDAIGVSKGDKLMTANDAFHNLFGYTSKNELIGQSVFDLIPPEQRLARQNTIKEQVAKGGRIPNEYETKGLRKDGSTFDLEVYHSNYSIDNVTYTQVILRDITKRKIAEKELEKYREHLEELVQERTAELEESNRENTNLSKAIEQSHATVVITDKEGNIEYVNPNFTRVTGYSSEEVVNQNPRFLRSGIMPDSHYKEMWDTINSGNIWRGEFVNKKKNGEFFWESAIISSISNEAGEIIRFVAVKEDISDRKKVEEELIQYKLFADNSIEGFGMANMDAEITYMNKKLCEVTGTDKPTLNETFYQFYPEEVKKILKDKILPEVVLKGHWKGEIDHLHPEGGTFPTYHNFFLIKDENGQPSRLAAIITDITERKKIEAELKKSKELAEEANRAKSTFLANMSHEIRTPMNSILGFSELLSNKIEDPKNRSYLNAIHSSGKNLLTLINDILDLSKVEAGRLEINYEEVETNSFFYEIIDLFQLKVEEKGLNFIIQIDKSLPNIMLVDKHRLRQIISNLLSNAIKFTDKGFIRFSVKQEIQSIKPTEQYKKEFVDLNISIEDTGIGIAEDFLPDLFNTFSQEDGRMARQYGGTGLGLAISKRLAKMMNGDILVDTKINKGSTFSIALNKVRVSHKTMKFKNGETFKLGQVMFQANSVLIVDDNENVREYFKDVLSEMGMRIEAAKNGKEALDKAKKTNLDLIITDIKMPVMDGYELVRHLKEDPRLSRIPVIAISASVMKDSIKKILEHKFDGLLVKPILVDDLYTELMKFLPY